MALSIFCLVITSIIIARFLENRKYAVATIAHAILFIFLSLTFLFSSEWQPIQDMCIRWIGEEYYEFLHNAIIDSHYFVLGHLSALLVFELVAFVFLPILSVAIIIKKIREQYKAIKVNNVSFENVSLQSNIGINPNKDSSYSLNKTYLILGKLLN